MWDVARIWNALDRSWKAIEQYFTTTHTVLGSDQFTISIDKAKRADPSLRPDLSPESRSEAKRHLVWMKEEILRLAAQGELDKAQRFLGFFQGASWAMGMASIQTFRDANRASAPLETYRVDDYVQCLGEAQDTFRVAKVSEGAEESTGSAYLLRVDGTDHGWEDFRKLRRVSNVVSKVAELKQRALEIRKMGDDAWDRGRKSLSSDHHKYAAKLELEAADLERKSKE